MRLITNETKDQLNWVPNPNNSQRERENEKEKQMNGRTKRKMNEKNGKKLATT
jgi:hypothetical protein